MFYTVYILYSEAACKYYCGCTSMSVADRLRRHNSNHRGFTGPYADWACIWSREVSNKTAALKLEKQIKSRGISRFLDEQSGWRIPHRREGRPEDSGPPRPSSTVFFSKVGYKTSPVVSYNGTFMFCTVYILYSETAEKHYCGYTSLSIPDRLRRHNSHHRGFTGPYSDWRCVWSRSLSRKSQALRMEKQIKSRGISRFPDEQSG